MTFSALGPYEIRGELGRGAMAVVWRGYDTRLDREVAIKEPVMPSGIDGATREEFAARFIREGKAAAGLNHPGIVTIFSADVYDGRPVIVMELIEGETLSGVLDRGPLTPEAAFAAADQLLDAIGYAHGRGIVHRDIKPDNVFVTADGRVKLTDFGIAHVGTTATLTQAGTVMGTPGYMAPEQVLGHPTDSRADLFAVGVLLHEMLAGANPFGATDGTPPTTVMYRIVHEPAPPLPAALAGRVPAWTEPVLGRALAKDAAMRFADAAEMRAALRGAAVPDAVAGVPTMVAGAPVPVKAPGGMPKWLPYAIVGAIGVAVIGGLLVASSGPPAGGPAQPPVTEAPDVEPEPEPEPEPAPAPAGPDIAALDAEIRSMLDRWRVSRETLDYNTYMSFYASDFVSSDGQNYSTWASKKRQIYTTTDPPTIYFDAPSIQIAPDGASAVVSVQQTYYSNGINDTMVKHLTMRREAGGWKILTENQ